MMQKNVNHRQIFNEIKLDQHQIVSLKKKAKFKEGKIDFLKIKKKKCHSKQQ